VWRDGGNISALSQFKDHESAQMQKTVALRCPEAKYSFVVVQKRIAQRFFAVDKVHLALFAKHMESLHCW
jgi:hypothetical protein